MDRITFASRVALLAGCEREKKIRAGENARTVINLFWQVPKLSSFLYGLFRAGSKDWSSIMEDEA